jgi:hypothetical protein
MLGSRNFRAATAAKTPNFSQAAAQQGVLGAREQARIDALRQNQFALAVEGYDELTGDNTPITDFANDMYDNAFGADPDVAGGASIVGRDAGSIDPMNIGDGSGLSPVTNGETFDGDFNSGGDWLGGGDGMIDESGSTIMDVEPAIDTGVRSDLVSAIDDVAVDTGAEVAGEAAGEVAGEAAGEVAGEAAGEVAGEVAGSVAGDALDAVGGLGGIAKIATAEDPAGEAAIQGALQAAQLIPGLGQAAMVANLLRAIV